MLFLRARGVEGDVSFKEDTLIVPVVSTGNVGQLAVDLFLSSGRVESPPLAEKVGYLESELVAPVAGYEVFGPGQPPQLCVNLELHRFAKSGVTVLQQRGPVFPGEEQAFAAELVKWARDSGFKEILALTGADAAAGLDPAPLGRGGMKRFRPGSAVGARGGRSQPQEATCALEEAFEKAGIGAFDLSGVMGAGWPMAPVGGSPFDAPGGGLAAGGIGLEMAGLGGGGDEDDDFATPGGIEGTLPFSPLPTGTGIAGLLCQEALSAAEQGTEGSPPLVVLLHFCGEGDNTPHAIEMAEAVNAVLDVLPGDGTGGGEVRWSSPLSWASLYGPPPAGEAYQ